MPKIRNKAPFTLRFFGPDGESQIAPDETATVPASTWDRYRDRDDVRRAQAIGQYEVLPDPDPVARTEEAILPADSSSPAGSDLGMDLDQDAGRQRRHRGRG